MESDGNTTKCVGKDIQRTVVFITYCTLCGRIKGAASAISVIQHSLRGGVRNTARHVITVIVVAFLTQENKAGKMQKYTKSVKARKGCAVRDSGTRAVVSIDHTPRTIIARTALPSVF